jgi:peptidoglycan/xylan/chitin deacetylase (PgdA/CDA1 family)
MLSMLAAELTVGASAAGGAGLAAGGFAYAALWPGSRIFGEALMAPLGAGEVALTFDDGPNPVWTPRLLDALARHQTRVTFFVVGSFAAREPALVRRMVAEGHVVGNHSWSHLNLALTSAARVQEELTRSSRTLEEITGAPVRFFRPPFGARRPRVLRLAREMGLIPVLWNAMTSDWKLTSTDKIVQRLRHRIDTLALRGSAANIVLHDGSHKDAEANRAPSVAAAERLIEHYQRNRRFVTLDAWV